MSDPEPADRARDLLGRSRWWQLAAVALMMGLVSPYQYVWSSIEGPLAQSLDIPLPALGMVFTLFVVFQSGSQFPAGWWRDRFGPRRLTVLSGVLAGGGYIGLAYATTVWQLYVLYSLGAIGVGIIYMVAINTAIKWFPDRLGLTTGISTMAFASGSALFVPYVRANATAAAYSDVLRNIGLLIGVGVVAGAFVLRDPPADWLAPADEVPVGDPDRETAGATNAGPVPDDGSDDNGTADGSARGRQYTWREMARTWQFWLMYAMFVAVGGAGLMLTAKVVSFAENLGLAALVATISATVLPLASGVGRLVVGDLSDRVDRELTMAASFLLCGIGLFSVVWFAELGIELGFVIAVIVAIFFWAPMFSLFPSVVGDYYGETYSSANNALLYSGKMWGGVIGGAFAGVLVALVGWSATFLIGGGLAICAGLGAFLLRPPPDA